MRRAKAMVMQTSTMHRVELLQHRLGIRFESWSSRDGSVVLMRRYGEDSWAAVVDRHVVTDADRMNGPMACQSAPGEEPDPTMVSADPEELALRLAMQERLHLVFDKTGETDDPCLETASTPLEAAADDQDDATDPCLA